MSLKLGARTLSYLSYLSKYKAPSNLMSIPILKILKKKKKSSLANVMCISGIVNLNFILHNNERLQKSIQIPVLPLFSTVVPAVIFFCPVGLSLL